MTREIKLDKLQISISETRDELGAYGAEIAARAIVETILEKGEANIIFASAPSQMDVLTALLDHGEIDWTKVNAFHMDEYIGADICDDYSFAGYIKRGFLSKIPVKNSFYLNGIAPDPTAECARYAMLLKEYPVDISFMGIGENGHLAFNDPHIANFSDPLDVKINPALDDDCIGQQVRDGWFKAIADVPKTAMTITIPALVRAKYLFTTVPSSSKATIIKAFTESDVSVSCPSTIIRQYDNSFLFLDTDSASLSKKL